MSNDKNTNAMQNSVTSIYAELLQKRKEEREAKEIRKMQKKEEKAAAKLEKEENEPKLSKKEKRARELENWKEIVVGLTGDDLDYISDSKKPKKKKYSKWIDDDDSQILPEKKPKKVKKKNYNKEFENELNMLKTLVADQNKFTNDLQKRFINAAGPATKDGMPLNKTLVDLAAAINASRSNSLGVLREIGGIKKTIADLYMKQKKLDTEIGGGDSSSSSQDIGLMGSSIASALFGQAANNISAATSNNYDALDTPVYTNDSSNNSNATSSFTPSSPSVNTPVVNQVQQNAASIPEFDPDSWNGISGGTNVSYYETIPHDIVLELHKDNNQARFKAVRKDNGEELVGCPVPTSDPASLIIDEKNMVVKGQFDELWKLEIV